MSSTNRAISNAAFKALTLAALAGNAGYTAAYGYRITGDLVQAALLTIPADLAMMLWLAVLQGRARGQQRAPATIGVVVGFTISAAATVAELLTPGGMAPGWLTLAARWATAAGFVIHSGLLLWFVQADPDTAAEADAFEAEGDIIDLTQKRLKANLQAQSAQIAEQLASHAAEAARQRLTQHLPPAGSTAAQPVTDPEPQALPELPPVEIHAHPNGTGRKNRPAP